MSSKKQNSEKTTKHENQYKTTSVHLKMCLLTNIAHLRLQDFFSHAKSKYYMCTFFCHALKKILLAPARAGWSENDVTIPRSVSPPWKAFPDHTAPVDTPFWFLHPLRLSPSMNTENQVLGDAYFMWLPGQPSQIVISSTPSEVQDLPSILYPHTTPGKSTYKVRLC